MRFLVRNISLTVAIVTAAIIGFCLAVVFAVYGATHEAVPQQSLVLTIVLPIIILPALLYPLLAIYRRQNVLARELERQAHTDALTGLPNRRAFFEFADVVLRGAPVSKVPPAAMTIDIDNFKSVNDRFGHDQGDIVLCRVGGVIRTEVEATGAARRIAARIGGEEFAVITAGLAPSAVARLAERICNQVNLSVGAGSHLEPVTVSVGVAFHRHGMKIDRLLKLSDDAVYAAKRAGRDRWAFASAETAAAGPDETRAAS